MNNYAFIDSQNLYLSILRQGWKLDFRRFRIFLKDKYRVNKAFLFLGYVSENKVMYERFRRDGYILVFKPVLKGVCNVVRGNIDADLVLKTMIEYPNFDKAVVVSGDGDFYSLIKYLYEKDKLEKLIIPDVFKYSRLLKFAAPNRMSSLNNLRHRLEYKNERQLHKD